jgi:signal transduction histidine kinase
MEASSIQSIPKQVASRVMRILGLGIGLQLVVIVGAMFFLSWRDAISRGRFLASSNEKSIGLLLATGDLLQLKNLASSFESKYVTRVLFVSAGGENILESVGDHDDGLSHFKNEFFSIKTYYPIKYNDRILGHIVLWNRIAVEDWLYICAVWLISAIILLFFITRKIKEFALSIGSSVESVVSIFDNHVETERPQEHQSSKKFLETYTLTVRIKEILQKLIENARLEKEATVGRLTSQISHDMRAPLGIFEQLMVSEPKSEIGRFQPAVRESLNRLHSMIESLRQSEVEVLIKKKQTRVDFNHGLKFPGFSGAI